jgi:hypothetical protein
MTLEKSFIVEEMPILRLSSENRLSAATTSLEWIKKNFVSWQVMVLMVA